MELKTKESEQKVKRYLPLHSKPISLLFHMWDAKVWSVLTSRKKEIYKWKITRLLQQPINPAHQYPVALETAQKVPALIPLIWLKLTFDKIPSNKLISMALAMRNTRKEKKKMSVEVLKFQLKYRRKRH